MEHNQSDPSEEHRTLQDKDRRKDRPSLV